MKSMKLGIYGLALIYVLSLVVVVPQSATAQQSDRPLKIQLDNSGIKVIIPEGKPRLAPETAMAFLEFPFVVTVPGPSECVGESITVVYEVVEKPSAATVTLPLGSETKPYSGDSPAGVPPVYSTTPVTIDGWKATVQVSFTRLAPAFVPQAVRLEAQAFGGAGTSSGCSSTESIKTVAETQIIPDYFPSVQYLPDPIVINTGQNKKISFPVTVINFSNGPTRVSATIPDTKGLAAITPPPGEILFESKATQGDKALNTQKLSITVQTPNKNGYTNKVYSFDANFMAKSDTLGEGLLTQAVTLTFSVKVQGVYVPGFDFTSMIAGLGVVLVGLGMARRRA